MAILNKCLWLGFVCIAAKACKPRLELREGYYFHEATADSIPYQVFLNPRAQKHILLLPSHYEAMPWPPAMGAEFLSRQGYTVVYLPKAQKGDFYRFTALDYRENRLLQIEKTYLFLQKQLEFHREKPVILGFGEGAYLAPALGSSLKADSIYMVNAGPFSPLFELERSLSDTSGTDSCSRNYLRRNFGFDRFSELAGKIQKVKDDRPDAYALGKNQNIYWLSYYQASASQDFLQFNGKAHWVFFENHPLHRDSNVDYLRVLNAMRKDSLQHIGVLPGCGNWNGNEDVVLFRELISDWL